MAEWAGLTVEDLSAIMEGLQTEYPDLAAQLKESYTSFNGFAADVLAVLGLEYTPEDSLGDWLLDLVNTMSEAMGISRSLLSPPRLLGCAAPRWRWIGPRKPLSA